MCFTDYAKAIDCVDHNKLWKILRDGNIRSPYLPPAKPVCRSRSKLQPDMEQRTSSKLGKEYIKAEYCHHAYLTYMQNTSCKMPGWMSYKLESRAGRNINNLRYADDTTLMAESEVELKSLLMRVKESEKTGLKYNIQKLRSWHSVPSLHGK